MRGEDERGGGLFSYADLEARVPADHPSRALLLQAFYTIGSERRLMEQPDYTLSFRWFVGLAMDAPVWDATVYSKNRDRLVAGAVAARFLQAVLRGARVRRLLSEEHSVDGTLIEAWASMKSFRRRDGGNDDAPPGRNAERDFRGEREAALAMLGRQGKRRRITLGADKAYDVAEFVDALRERAVTPHIAAASQRLRKRIEEGFGWIETTGGLAKTRHRRLDRVGWMFTLTAAAYNLVRLPKLLAEAPT